MIVYCCLCILHQSCLTITAGNAPFIANTFSHETPQCYEGVTCVDAL